MSAYYDSYDYPSYWIGREYEHNSEIIAIKSFLKNIPKISSVLEIGSGFGRLVPSYQFRAKKVILSDPSSKLLCLSRKKYKNKKYKFLHSKLENLPNKLKSKSVDLIIVVRVLHHICDISNAFRIFSKLNKKNGYLILEFANKRHLKAVLSEFLKGNITFPLDIFPKEVKPKKICNKCKLPFVNYHPDIIYSFLKKHRYKIMGKFSVSNIRSSFLKKYIPRDILLFIEKKFQKPFSYIGFGPSIFILAKKI